VAEREELRLRRKPFAILRFLTANPLRLVTQEEVVAAFGGKIGNEREPAPHAHE